MARILFCHWFWVTLVSGDHRVFPSSIFTLIRVSAGLLLSAAAEDESEVDCLEIDIYRKLRWSLIHMSGAGPGEERPQLRLPQDGGQQQQQRAVRVRQQLRESREGGGG